jgi:hypothetical protein
MRLFPIKETLILSRITGLCFHLSFHGNKTPLEALADVWVNPSVSCFPLLPLGEWKQKQETSHVQSQQKETETPVD